MKLDENYILIKDNLQNIIDGKFDNKFEPEQLKMMLELSFLLNHITWDDDSMTFEYNDRSLKLSNLYSMFNHTLNGISEVFTMIKDEETFKSCYNSFLRYLKLNDILEGNK